MPRRNQNKSTTKAQRNNIKIVHPQITKLAWPAKHKNFPSRRYFLSSRFTKGPVAESSENALDHQFQFLEDFELPQVRVAGHLQQLVLWS